MHTLANANAAFMQFHDFLYAFWDQKNLTLLYLLSKTILIDESLNSYSREVPKFAV